MNYTRLSFAEVKNALHDVARDARSVFGDLDSRQLNWRPDPTRWSVAQCFEHLHTANDLMYGAAKHALTNPPSTIWQRLPLHPRICGQLLIRSQAPQTKRKFT